MTMDKVKNHSSIDGMVYIPGGEFLMGTDQKKDFPQMEKGQFVK